MPAQPPSPSKPQPRGTLTGSVVAYARSPATAPAPHCVADYSVGENTYQNSLHLTAEQAIALTVAQLAELWDASAHGELAEVWFDGGWTGMKSNISALLASAQPTAVAFNGCVPPTGCIGTPNGGNTRWVGTESGVAPDPCTATSTSFSTISRPFLSSTSPHTCRVLCSTWCLC